VFRLGFGVGLLKRIIEVRRAPWGHLEHLSAFKILKKLHNNFYICKNFSIIKLKYCILIIFKKNLIRVFLCLTG